jgi:hypothetical protein
MACVSELLQGIGLGRMLGESRPCVLLKVTFPYTRQGIDCRQSDISMEEPCSQHGPRATNAREAMYQYASTLSDLRFNEGNDSRKIRRWPEIRSGKEEILKPELFGVGL